MTIWALNGACALVAVGFVRLIACTNFGTLHKERHMNPDEVLVDGRRALTAWEQADTGSPPEWEAAERISSAFAALDHHLSSGGRLPSDWEHILPLLTPREQLIEVLQGITMTVRLGRPELTICAEEMADQIIAGLAKSRDSATETRDVLSDPQAIAASAEGDEDAEPDGPAQEATEPTPSPWPFGSAVTLVPATSEGIAAAHRENEEVRTGAPFAGFVTTPDPPALDDTVPDAVEEDAEEASQEASPDEFEATESVPPVGLPDPGVPLDVVTTPELQVGFSEGWGEWVGQGWIGDWPQETAEVAYRAFRSGWVAKSEGGTASER